MSGVYPGALQHTLGSNGLLSWYSVPADTYTASADPLTYVARYTYSYLDSGSRTRQGVHELSRQALTALAIYRHDARIRGRAESLVGQRNSKVLQRTLASEFQP